MTSGYSFHAGNLPLLVSVPHDGRSVPDDIAAQMTDVGKSLPDTDWHVARLYGFVKQLGASMISAINSRYVVDLNRPADDAVMYEGQLATGLCPTQTFTGEDIYVDAAVKDKAERVERYWRPYHSKIAATLERLRATHGYALLWDAHSIASRVPLLFDGELPVLNIGTWDGRSCNRTIADAVVHAAADSSYDVALNARFKGGYITRHYGRPGDNVHSIQLELAQRAYMDESTTLFDEEKASQLRDTLATMLEAFIKTAADNAVILSR
ncbi:MAG: N-formylglutamate deformylase [Gammaproteobacteria bacterium]|nr:N-formylglutamate deformylase [Gammaproteobacteria bacterium]MDH3410460.1 N-formylglutamate deformylase [Gammaproteobacteria bacterium]MDH3551173.1 N-formylglutamate deformylase [Gammaproteobacteria bacterium]